LVRENIHIAFSADNHSGVAKKFGKSVSGSFNFQLRKMLSYKSHAGGTEYFALLRLWKPARPRCKCGTEQATDRGRINPREARCVSLSEIPVRREDQLPTAVASGDMVHDSVHAD
jgi:hypothetical protein